MPLVIATNNRGKVAEIADLLPRGFVLMTAAEVGVNLPEETGATYEENALLKARAVATTGLPALADDSGLEVDALAGAPGVRSARYAGAGASDVLNNTRLLHELDGVPIERRTARFRSVVALVRDRSLEQTASGAVEGRIVFAPRGTHGFGYDPLFELQDPDTAAENGSTMAELGVIDKNRISHRARAVRALLRALDEQGIDLVKLCGI